MNYDDIILEQNAQALLDNYLSRYDEYTTCSICGGEIYKFSDRYLYGTKVVCSDIDCRYKAASKLQEGEMLDFCVQEDYIGDFSIFINLPEHFIKNQKSKLEDLLVNSNGEYNPRLFIEDGGFEYEFVHHYEELNNITAETAD